MLFKRHQGFLHYDLIGPADAPVVCMTHSLTSDGGMWAEQVGPLLAAGYQVLRLDMRGHGGSTPFEGSYTIEELAADAIAILDMLGFDQVHLYMRIGRVNPKATTCLLCLRPCPTLQPTTGSRSS